MKPTHYMVYMHDTDGKVTQRRFVKMYVSLTDAIAWCADHDNYGNSPSSDDISDWVESGYMKAPLMMRDGKFAIMAIKEVSPDEAEVSLMRSKIVSALETDYGMNADLFDVETMVDDARNGEFDIDYMDVMRYHWRKTVIRMIVYGNTDAEEFAEKHNVHGFAALLALYRPISKNQGPEPETKK